MITPSVRRWSIVAAAVFASLSTVGATEPGSRMKIRISTSNQSTVAELEDNAAARDFLALLPLKLVLDDYGSTEKIADLPGKLSTVGSPTGMKPVTGDLTYYAPWGNLAIFIRAFSHSPGLVKLGRITSGLEHIGRSGPVPVTIERSAE